MATIKLSGVEGIKQLYPQSIRTLSIFHGIHRKFKDHVKKDMINENRLNKTTTELDLYSKSLDLKWSMWINIIYFKNNGIPLKKVENLLKYLFIKIETLPIELDDEVISLNPKTRKTIKEKVLSYISSKKIDVIMPEQLYSLHPQAYVDKKHKHIVFEGDTIPDNFVTIFQLANVKMYSYEYYIENVINNLETSEYIVLYTRNISNTTNENGKLFVKETLSPNDYINFMLESDDSFTKSEIQRLKALGIKVPIVEPSVLNRLGNYFYADADGSNLRMLFNHELIDDKRTTCNNPYEVLNIIGLESTRTHIIREFYDTIVNNGSYVTPLHLEVILNYMTNNYLSPVTSKGVSKQSKSAIANASFENPIIEFTKSSTFGKYEPVNSTSTGIFTGNKCFFGSNISQYRVNKDILNRMIEGRFKVPEIERKIISTEVRGAGNVNVIEETFTLPVVNLEALGNIEVFNGDVDFVEDTVNVDTVFETFTRPIIVKSVCPKGPIPIIEPCSLKIPDWLNQRFLGATDIIKESILSLKSRNKKFIRAGAVPFFQIESDIWYALFINAQYNQLTDAGGGIKVGENPIKTALRELSEESNGIFSFDDFDDTDIVIYNNRVLEVFKKVDVRTKEQMIEEQNEYRRRYEEKILSKQRGEAYNKYMIENSFLLWINESDLKRVVFYNGEGNTDVPMWQSEFVLWRSSQLSDLVPEKEQQIIDEKTSKKPVSKEVKELLELHEKEGYAKIVEKNRQYQKQPLSDTYPTLYSQLQNMYRSILENNLSLI